MEIGNVRVANIDTEVRQSYLDYAMSVIIGRAIPDVRDGLKPVHRRIMYSMHEKKNGPSGPHKKCARVVGDVIAKYHPHGCLLYTSDAADALLWVAPGGRRILKKNNQY